MSCADECNAMPLHCTAPYGPYLSYPPSVSTPCSKRSYLSIYPSRHKQLNHDQLNSEPCLAAAYRVSPSGCTIPYRTAETSKNCTAAPGTRTRLPFNLLCDMQKTHYHTSLGSHLCMRVSSSPPFFVTPMICAHHLPMPYNTNRQTWPTISREPRRIKGDVIAVSVFNFSYTSHNSPSPVAERSIAAD